jgi:GntR family transcriptional regulator
MAKYRSIAEDLAQRIRAGQYPPGSALPAQRDLAASYGASLATARQALDLLQDQGLLSQQAGRGTFVAEPKAAYRLSTLRSLADDLREQGQPVTTLVLGRSLRAAPARVAAQLGGDSRALHLERVRLLGDAPAIHQVSWIRAPYAEQLRDVDFGDRSLYGALADLGVVVHRASERLRPAALDAPAAAHLGQPAGTPVLISERLTFALDGDPVVFDRASILGDLVEIRAERAATGLTLRWTGAAAD